MAQTQYVVEPLGRHHDRAGFSCGSEPLDRYLREQAGQDVRNYLAAVFVLVDLTTQAVAGYYTLSATAVEARELPTALTRRLPRYPLLPAVLLGRLAVDSRYQGRGLGALLLTDALKRSLGLREQLGAMAVVVDAKDDTAQAIYERFGFQRFRDQEFRLYIPMGTIARLP